VVICNGLMQDKAKKVASETELLKMKGKQLSEKDTFSKDEMLSLTKTQLPEQGMISQKHARNEDGVISSDGKETARPLKRRVRFKPGLIDIQTMLSGSRKNDGNNKKRWAAACMQPKSILKKTVSGSGNKQEPTHDPTAAYNCAPNALDLLLLCTQVCCGFKLLTFPMVFERN